MVDVVFIAFFLLGEEGSDPPKIVAPEEG
jgi:hypothetical protein